MPTGAMPTGVILRHYGAHQAAAVRPDLLAVYTGLLRDGLRVPPTATAERFADVLRAETAAPGWSCVIAYHDGEPVGCGYGSPLPEDTNWWNGLLTPVPASLAAETGHRTLEYRQLMLRRAWRKSGTGRLLIDGLLGSYGVERAVCVTSPDQPRLHAYYMACGGRLLGDYRTPGTDTTPPNTAFLFPLPLPPAPA